MVIVWYEYTVILFKIFLFHYFHFTFYFIEIVNKFVELQIIYLFIY